MNKLAQDGTQLERLSVEFLHHQLGHYATFKHLGGSNPSQPDIVVNDGKKHDFNMEVKGTQARGGQFVVKTNHHGKLICGDNNRAWGNKYPKSLSRLSEQFLQNLPSIQHTNIKQINRTLNHTYYRKLSYQWVKIHYHLADNQYFITNTKKDNTGKMLVIPTNKIQNYFNCRPKLRPKKDSGTSKAGLKFGKSVIRQGYNHTQMKQELSRQHLGNYQIVPSGKRTYIHFKDSSLQHFQQLSRNNSYPGAYIRHFHYRHRDYTGFINKQPNKNGLYELRRRSHTANPTLSFILTLKPNISNQDIQECNQAFKSRVIRLHAQHRFGKNYHPQSHNHYSTFHMPVLKLTRSHCFNHVHVNHHRVHRKFRNIGKSKRHRRHIDPNFHIIGE